MALESTKTMELMLLRITRTRIRKSAGYPKQNQKIANAPQFFSRERTGRTYNILISAEELMKYSDIVGTALRPSDSYFYSTVSAENHMRSRPNHTAILSPRKLLLAPNLEFWRASRER